MEKVLTVIHCVIGLLMIAFLGLWVYQEVLRIRKKKAWEDD